MPITISKKKGKGMVHLSLYLAKTYNFDVGGASYDIQTGHIWLAIAFFLLMVVSLWKIFNKARRAGWPAIIPIYNTIVTFQITKHSGWWVLLLFIPIVNVVVSFMLSYWVAKAFGKGIGYTLLLFFLPCIGYPVLAFGKATYQLR